jgi:hypothetical protein
MAAFAYNAAMRDAMMPRKPLPKDEPEKKDEKKPNEAAAPPAKKYEVPPHH